MNQEIISNIFQLALTCGMGVVGFFLKRTISELDECKEEISYIKENYATGSSVEVCKSDITKIKENYTTREELFREQAEIRHQLNRIMEILLDIKGEKKS